MTVEEFPQQTESVDVPEEWRRIGFSGLFWVEATLEEPDKADEFEVRLPDRVPFHTNSGWSGAAAQPRGRPADRRPGPQRLGRTVCEAFRRRRP